MSFFFREWLSVTGLLFRRRNVRRAERFLRLFLWRRRSGQVEAAFLEFVQVGSQTFYHFVVVVPEVEAKSHLDGSIFFYQDPHFFFGKNVNKGVVVFLGNFSSGQVGLNWLLGFIIRLFPIPYLQFSLKNKRGENLCLTSKALNVKARYLFFT